MRHAERRFITTRARGSRAEIVQRKARDTATSTGTRLRRFEALREIYLVSPHCRAFFGHGIEVHQDATVFQVPTATGLSD